MKKVSLSPFLRVSLIYAFFAGLFIILSSQLLAKLATDVEQLAILGIYVGCFFVVVTTLLLYWLLRREWQARERTEVERRASDAQLLNLLDVSVDAIISVNEAQRILRFNQGAEQIFGYAAAEVIGQPLGMLLPERLAESHRQHIQAFAHTPEVALPMGERGHILGRRKDSLEFPAEASISKVTQAGQTIFTIILRDITERRQIEESLRESEARYRSLIESTYDLIQSVAPDGRFIFVNRAWREALGYTEAEVADLNVFDVIHPDALAHCRDIFNQVMAGGWVNNFQTIFISKDGRSIWVEGNVTGRYLGDELIATHGFFHDITIRKQGEAALRESQQFLQSTLDALSTEIAILDETGRVIAINAPWRRFGEDNDYAGADMGVGLNYLDICDNATGPDSAEAAAAATGIRQVLANQRSLFYLEYPCHSPTEQRWFGMRVTRFENQGKIWIVVAHQNITERKQAEALVRQAEQRYRNLFEEAPIMYVTTRDEAGVPIISDCNQLFLKTLGYSRAEVIDRPLADFYTPGSRLELSGGGYQAALAGDFAPRERQLVTREGVVVETLLHALPKTDSEGQVYGTRAMYVNITQRKQAEAALAEERALLVRRVAERTADLSAANAELARAARLKDEFLANMSHELRTPLNAVLGMAEGLQQQVYGPLNEKQLKSLHRIEESGRHLLELINDILDLSKIEAGKLDLQPDPVSVEAVCQASLRLIKQQAHAKQIKVSLTIDQQVMTPILADERRLKQILVNLLSNAVKFTSEGGQVGLEVAGQPYATETGPAEGSKGVIQFTVWDTGIGIAAEDMSSLFQPFVQLDSSLSRRYAGTGLGLTLVSRMVELHGGSVSVESEPGQGSRFTVSLPWRVEEARRRGHEEVESREVNEHEELLASSPLVSSASLILLAEDNPANIETLTDYLQAIGFRVVVAHNGAEAIARAKADRPDLVLMDIQMPEMNGLEATRRFRADSDLAAIPIIALTSLAMPGDRERCLAAGANEYLSKPVGMAELVKVIEQQLSKKQVTG